MTKTFHIYPVQGSWAVQKEGKKPESFHKQREAIATARSMVKASASGQFVLYAKDGRIREHESHGMTVIQNPPRHSKMATRIGQAVGKVTPTRIQSSHPSPLEPPPAK